MPQFRKKPVVITAELFDQYDFPWPVGIVRDDRSPTGFSIGTLENTASGHEVTPGDWIITGVQGERYPCKPDIFAVTYDRVGMNASDVQKERVCSKCGAIVYTDAAGMKTHRCAPTPVEEQPAV
jgi:hypothetical protein